MAQWTRSNLVSLLLASMTDADSPVSQALTDKMLYYFEQFLLMMLDTGESGTITTITQTVLTDSGQSWSVDEHNGRTLLITSGAAIGRLYTIDDTTATTITMTGDTLVTDGVVTTDTFIILYDFIVNTDGHDHDGINSRSVVLADSVVTTAKLADEAVSEAKLGHVMRNIFTSSDQVTAFSGGNETAWTERGRFFFYRQANMDTLYWKGTFTDTANFLSTFRFSVDGVNIDTSAFDTGTWDLSGSGDISSAGTGWIEVIVYSKKSGAHTGTNAVTALTLNVY